MKVMRCLVVIGCLLAGCASGSPQLAGAGFDSTPSTPATIAAIQALSAPDKTGNASLDEDYNIGPLDKIDVIVFGQKDLTIQKIQVDSSGQVVLPLIGAVTIGGKTSKAASEEIAARYGESYLNNPSVSVIIEESVSQRVTVAGAVVQSGVYSLKGKTTLLQAISMAKGPDFKTANLKMVAIFRTVNGRRARAVFDVAQIEKGESDDPVVFGGDTVVVPESRSLRTWREIVGALPALGVFAYL